MKKIWEFFENLNEFVYVADIDSHELVYMNKKTREMYGLSSMEEALGKKCYELLQGNSAPCAMCNKRKEISRSGAILILLWENICR